MGRSQRDRVRLRLEAGAEQRLVTAWSGYAAWWYAVCVELFVSKGEKAIEVESTFSSFLSIVIVLSAAMESLNLFARRKHTGLTLESPLSLPKQKNSAPLRDHRCGLHYCTLPNLSRDHRCGRVAWQGLMRGTPLCHRCGRVAKLALERRRVQQRSTRATPELGEGRRPKNRHSERKSKAVSCRPRASRSSSQGRDVGSALSGLRFLALPVGRSGWLVLVPCRSWLFPLVLFGLDDKGTVPSTGSFRHPITYYSIDVYLLFYFAYLGLRVKGWR